MMIVISKQVFGAAEELLQCLAPVCEGALSEYEGIGKNMNRRNNRRKNYDNDDDNNGDREAERVHG